MLVPFFLFPVCFVIYKNKNNFYLTVYCEKPFNKYLLRYYCQNLCSNFYPCQLLKRFNKEICVSACQVLFFFFPTYVEGLRDHVSNWLGENEVECNTDVSDCAQWVPRFTREASDWLKPVSRRLAQGSDERAGSFPSASSAHLDLLTAPPTVLWGYLVTWWGWFGSTRGKPICSSGGEGGLLRFFPPPPLPVLRDLAWSGEYLLARARSGSLQVRLRGEEEEEAEGGGGRRRRPRRGLRRRQRGCPCSSRWSLRSWNRRRALPRRDEAPPSPSRAVAGLPGAALSDPARAPSAYKTLHSKIMIC